MTYTEKFVILNRRTEQFTIALLKNPSDVLAKAALDATEGLRKNLINDPTFELGFDA